MSCFRSTLTRVTLGVVGATVCVAPITMTFTGAAASALPLPALPASASTAPAAVHPSGIVVNEIIYGNASGYDIDQVEILNTGTAAVDVSGWGVADDKNKETLPAGTVVQPGEYFMLVNGTHFTFGLGKGDSFTLSDLAGVEVDGYAYTNDAPLMTWARCGDGLGEWAPATQATPGAANMCTVAPVQGSVKLNEVDSQPADWVELVNPGDDAVSLDGFELRDNSDDHRWRFPAGTVIEPGALLVVDENSSGSVFNDTTGAWQEGRFPEAIGIGGADEIRLFASNGDLADRTGAWTAHAAIDGDAAAATLARCVDGEGDFALAFATPGEKNRCVPPSIAINEVESNGDATDWVEITNTGATPIDISGWTMLDNDPAGHAADVIPVPAGTMLAPGGFYVFDQPSHFTFGLGKADTVSVRTAAGLVAAEYSWSDHAAGVYGRCVDGTGEFRDLEISTKGLQNACGNPVRINEVVSNPSDWVELVNPSAHAIDISGIVVRDNDDAHEYTIPAGTSIPAGGYLVIEGDALGFGLGKADSVRLFENGTLINETTWGPEHAEPSWGRCPDVDGPFAVTSGATKGAANTCVGEISADPWPGAAETRVLDTAPMFLSDSSGLDTQVTDEGVFLWAVDNGAGTFWKLAAQADGSVKFADGWESGKRARFQHDATNPGAAGPDTEGITVAGDGFLYLASERDNSAKGVNYNTVLQIDPNAPGPDVVASQQWDLTSLLPQVSANLGLEAIEWVSDSDLEGVLWDRNTKAPYKSSDYAGHGDGLFFVGVEDQGQVFAVALLPGGQAEIVGEVKPGLPGVMALDYDTTLGVLWAVCDDGCDGTGAQISLNGTETPKVNHVLRPAGLPNLNNEGFATAPAELIVDGKRPAWWFADGYSVEALRAGWLNAESPIDPVDPVDPVKPTTPGGSGNTAGNAGGAAGGGSPGALANTGEEASLIAVMIAAGVALAAAGVALVGSRKRKLQGQ